MKYIIFSLEAILLFAIISSIIVSFYFFSSSTYNELSSNIKLLRNYASCEKEVNRVIEEGIIRRAILYVEEENNLSKAVSYLNSFVNLSKFSLIISYDDKIINLSKNYTIAIERLDIATNTSLRNLNKTLNLTCYSSIKGKNVTVKVLYYNSSIPPTQVNLNCSVINVNSYYNGSWKIYNSSKEFSNPLKISCNINCLNCSLTNYIAKVNLSFPSLNFSIVDECNFAIFDVAKVKVGLNE